MQRRYVTLDVFTRQRFCGNPLAVVLDAEGLSAADMQSLAREFGFSETTFVLPPRNPQHTAWVRIFTPTREVPFAGHPNVGTAVAVANEMHGRGVRLPAQFLFEEGAGLVELTLLQEADRVIGAQFKSPQSLTAGARVSLESVASCLSLVAGEIASHVHAPRVLSVGLPFLVAQLTSRDALRRAQPVLAQHERVLPPLGTDSLFAYVRADESLELDARMFAPLDACQEDPATGSAVAATLALLASLKAEPAQVLDWRVRQGQDMQRASLIKGRTEVRSDGSIAVLICGEAVTVMQGTVEIP